MPTAPILARSNSTETNQAPPQHMVDIVKEAMKAANTRNQGQLIFAERYLLNVLPF